MLFHGVDLLYVQPNPDYTYRIYQDSPVTTTTTPVLLRRQGAPVHPAIPDLERLDARFALGYTSVGCWPCTERPDPEADPRSGRWARSTRTECGLHL